MSQAHMSSSDDQEVLNPSFGNKLSDFPKAVKYLCHNPPFVCLIITGCAEGMLLSGMATFGPKVIETQFGRTAGESSLLMGESKMISSLQVINEVSVLVNSDSN